MWYITSTVLVFYATCILKQNHSKQWSCHKLNKNLPGNRTIIPPTISSGHHSHEISYQGGCSISTRLHAQLLAWAHSHTCSISNLDLTSFMYNCIPAKETAVGIKYIVPSQQLATSELNERPKWFFSNKPSFLICGGHFTPWRRLAYPQGPPTCVPCSKFSHIE